MRAARVRIGTALLLAGMVAGAPLPGQAQRPVGSPATAQAAAPLPVSAYAEPPFMSDARLSPDGQRIAYRVAGKGADRIGIWQLAAGPDQQPVTFAAPGVQSFRWAGDHKLLMTTLRSVNGGAAVFNLSLPVQRVFSRDLRTGVITALGDGGGMLDELIYVEPEGAYVLLASQPSLHVTPAVYRIELTQHRAERVERPRAGVWNWYADRTGAVRIGVDYNQRNTRILYRDAASAPLRTIEIDRNIADRSSVDSVHFLGTGTRAVMVTNAANGRFGVYEYDFASDTRAATLFEHPEADVEEPILGPDGAVQGVTYDDGRPQTRWLVPELQELQSTIDRTLPNKTNVVVNRSRDGNRILIWSSAPDDSGTYYIFDRVARRMEAFVSPYERLQQAPLSSTRPISYRSRDGLTIRAYLTLPRGRPERSLPLIVLPHGGPFLRDRWVFDPEVQFLASRGYAVLQPNFRGSTGFGRQFVERGYGQLGAGMIDDMDDGVAWLAQQNIADPARVCIMGGSYGGYAAIWAATRNPQLYRCAISWAGPSDLRTMLRHTDRGFGARRYSREFQRQIEGAPRTDLDAVSPLRHAARLRVPVLVAHGRNDQVVPVDQSERLINALRRGGANVEGIIYPRSGHSFDVVEEREDYLQRVETFLARHNPSAPR